VGWGNGRTFYYYVIMLQKRKKTLPFLKPRKSSNGKIKIMGSRVVKRALSADIPPPKIGGGGGVKWKTMLGFGGMGLRESRWKCYSWTLKQRLNQFWRIIQRRVGKNEGRGGGLLKKTGAIVSVCDHAKNLGKSWEVR